ncbi:MAG: hypothetical protein L0027_15580 [Candidatus Rokubacteria bacterium]|nr:hypothetical protein [Candidatus Rokubacteria bacterium]
MPRAVLLVLALVALWPAVGQPAGAVSFALDERQRAEAIAVGRESIVSEEFGGEWTVRGSGGQSVTVMSPFHRVALAARNATFRQKVLEPREVEAALKETTGKLILWTTVKGGKADFARFLTPTLLNGGAAIRPSFVQNERTPVLGGDGRYIARCVYVFPSDGLPPAARVTLVVRDRAEAEVAKFQVDLGAMR